MPDVIQDASSRITKICPVRTVKYERKSRTAIANTAPIFKQEKVRKRHVSHMTDFDIIVKYLF